MNYTRHFECGCKVVVIGELTNAVINYCPKHKATPLLYEALDLIRSKALLWQLTEEERERVIKALAEAEGGETS